MNKTPRCLSVGDRRTATPSGRLGPERRHLAATAQIPPPPPAASSQPRSRSSARLRASGSALPDRERGAARLCRAESRRSAGRSGVTVASRVTPSRSQRLSWAAAVTVTVTVGVTVTVTGQEVASGGGDLRHGGRPAPRRGSGAGHLVEETAASLGHLARESRWPPSPPISAAPEMTSRCAAQLPARRGGDPGARRRA